MVTKFLKIYGGALATVAIGVVTFVITRGDGIESPADCNRISGVVSEAPKSGGADESKYLGLRLTGYKDFYIFSRCSYSKRIVSVIVSLKVGDPVTLYVSRQSSPTTWPWSGGSYKTYRIVEASVPGNENVVGFDNYQGCSDRETNVLLPILCGFFVLMGVFQFIRIVWDDQSKRELGKPANAPVDENAGGKITLRPDRFTFVLKNSFLPALLVVLGVWMNRSVTPERMDFVGLMILGWGLYMFINTFVKSERTLYVIDQAGVHLYEQPMFFNKKTLSIPYAEITEVVYRQSLYEIWRDRGSVFIDHGDTDSDGNKVYAKLTGVENYKEIARLINERSAIEYYK